MADFPAGVDPRILWLREIRLIATRIRAAGIDPSLLGVDESQISIANVVAGEFLNSMTFIRSQLYDRWNHLDTSAIQHSDDGNFARLDVFAALEVAKRYLSQDILNFITCRDIRGASLGSLYLLSRDNPVDNVEDLLKFDQSDHRLALAFRNQMISQSEGHTPIVGAFVLERPPLELLDDSLSYDFLRLVITPQGIFYTIINSAHNVYVPCYWTPAGINTGAVWLIPQITFALDVMLAGIWRDACVVREKWVHTQVGNKGSSPKLAGNKLVRNMVTIPRVVYKSQWVATVVGQRNAPGLAYWVKGFYRYVAEDFEADAEAMARAERYGYGQPPTKYTFVVPHVRGGAAVAVPRQAHQDLRWNGADVVRFALQLKSNSDK